MHGGFFTTRPVLAVALLLVWFSSQASVALSSSVTTSVDTGKQQIEQRDAVDEAKGGVAKRIAEDRDTQGFIIEFNEPGVVRKLLDNTPAVVRLNNQPQTSTAQSSQVGAQHQTLRASLTSSKAMAIRQSLRQQQSQWLTRLNATLSTSSSGLQVGHQFTDLLNALELHIEPDQARQLLSDPAVKAIYPNRIRRRLLDGSLEAIKAASAWQQVGGTRSAGSGVRIAIVDSGIAVNHPMFDDTNIPPPPNEYRVDDDHCARVDPSFCNNKIILARAATPSPEFNVFSGEYQSPRDYEGHGTHVAGTAAGVSVQTEFNGNQVTLSGVAPAAYLMIYKGLYTTTSAPDISSGTDAMLIAMLEAALNDGADVINNSWGSAEGEPPSGIYAPILQQLEAAGVVVVFAAGNSGPDQQSISCPACNDDVLAVGSSLNPRLFANRLDVPAINLSGRPALLSGPITPSSDTVHEIVHLGSIEANNQLGCDPIQQIGQITDRLVLIERGECFFAEKINHAQTAGALGVVIYNNVNGGELPILMGGLSDDQRIPSWMIAASDGLKLADYLDQNESTEVRISASINRTTSRGAQLLIDATSSRGPNGDPSQLKPDLIAPGSPILSAVSADVYQDDFTQLNGTSMAAPHVSGAAAVVRAQHPQLTANEVRAILMNTAHFSNLKKSDGQRIANNFDTGAGLLDVAAATQASLLIQESSVQSPNCANVCTFSVTLSNLSSKAQTVELESLIHPQNTAKLSVIFNSSTVTLPPEASLDVTFTVVLSDVLTADYQHARLIFRTSTQSYSIPVSVYPSANQTGDFVATTTPRNIASDDRVQLTSRYVHTQRNETVMFTANINERLRVVADSVDLTLDGRSLMPTVTDQKIQWSGQLTGAEVSSQPSQAIADYNLSNGRPAYTPLATLNASTLVCGINCDDLSLPLSLERPITYFGNSYQQMHVSTNGYVSLGAVNSQIGSANPLLLPSDVSPNNLVAPLWTDFDLDGSSSIDDGFGRILVADVDQKYFVIEWEDVEIFGSANNRNSFQLWFEYDTGNVHFVYGELDQDALSTAAFTNRLSIGLENSSGMIGTNVSYITSTERFGVIPSDYSEMAVSINGGSQLALDVSADVVELDATFDDQITTNEDQNVIFDVLENDDISTLVSLFTVDTSTTSVFAAAVSNTDFAPVIENTLEIIESPRFGQLEQINGSQLRYMPDENRNGTDSFIYQVARDDGTDTASTVEISVLAVNDSPIITVSAPQQVSSNQTFRVSVDASDVDDDELSVTIDDRNTSSLELTAPSQAQLLTIPVSVSDGESTITREVRITVLADTIDESQSNSGGGVIYRWFLYLLLCVFSYRAARYMLLKTVRE